MSTPAAIYLKDYTVSAFLIETIDLDVALFGEHTRVASRLALRRNPASTDPRAALVLEGIELTLESIKLDGKPVAPADYVLDCAHLTMSCVPNEFVLETVCLIKPQDNTQLSGFFASKDGCFTQCEAEGFRRITWFTDRPDVMARYTATLHADSDRYPVLLANGNLTASGEEPATHTGGAARHWAKWVDPFPKPSYLFAMVAAKLDMLEDSFVTRSGKNARLAVYVEPGKLDQAGFAMQALKRASQMRGLPHTCSARVQVSRCSAAWASSDDVTTTRKPRTPTSGSDTASWNNRRRMDRNLSAAGPLRRNIDPGQQQQGPENRVHAHRGVVRSPGHACLL